jgi:hypothetical protein
MAVGSVNNNVRSHSSKSMKNLGLMQAKQNKEDEKKAQNNQSAQNTQSKQNTQNTQNQVNVQTNNNQTRELSEKAQEYLKKLQEKFGDVNFVIVQGDVTGNEKAGSSTSKYNCFISVDLLEKMAHDEDYAAKYEGMITQAIDGLDDLKEQIKSAGLFEHVEGLSFSINSSGETNFFIMLKDSVKDLHVKREKPEKPEWMNQKDWEHKQWRQIGDSSIDSLLDKLKAIIDGKMEVPKSFWELQMEEMAKKAEGLDCKV